MDNPGEGEPGQPVPVPFLGDIGQGITEAHTQKHRVCRQSPYAGQPVTHRSPQAPAPDQCGDGDGDGQDHPLGKCCRGEATDQGGQPPGAPFDEGDDDEDLEDEEGLAVGGEQKARGGEPAEQHHRDKGGPTPEPAVHQPVEQDGGGHHCRPRHDAPCLVVGQSSTGEVVGHPHHQRVTRKEDPQRCRCVWVAMGGDRRVVAGIPAIEYPEPRSTAQGAEPAVLHGAGEQHHHQMTPDRPDRDSGHRYPCWRPPRRRRSSRPDRPVRLPRRDDRSARRCVHSGPHRERTLTVQIYGVPPSWEGRSATPPTCTYSSTSPRAVGSCPGLRRPEGVPLTVVNERDRQVIGVPSPAGPGSGTPGAALDDGTGMVISKESV